MNRRKGNNFQFIIQIGVCENHRLPNPSKPCRRAGKKYLHLVTQRKQATSHRKLPATVSSLSSELTSLARSASI